MTYKFKGTNNINAWKYENDGDGMRFDGVSVYVDNCYENYRADAQAISQVPNMIDYLTNRFKYLDKQELNVRNQEYLEWEELNKLLKNITTY